MIKKISYDDFKRIFRENSKNIFSNEGLLAMFLCIDEYIGDNAEEVTLDLIATCNNYKEYHSVQHRLSELNIDDISKDSLYKSRIAINNNSFIIRDEER